jgi:hypothetical protein
MSYFEMLRQGSPFHRVRINSERSISILPIDDGDDDWIRFQQVVAEAEENAGFAAPTTNAGSSGLAGRAPSVRHGRSAPQS